MATIDSDNYTVGNPMFDQVSFGSGYPGPGRHETRGAVNFCVTLGAGAALAVNGFRGVGCVSGDQSGAQSANCQALQCRARINYAVPISL